MCIRDRLTLARERLTGHAAYLLARLGTTDITRDDVPVLAAAMREAGVAEALEELITAEYDAAITCLEASRLSLPGIAGIRDAWQAQPGGFEARDRGVVLGRDQLLQRLRDTGLAHRGSEYRNVVPGDVGRTQPSEQVRGVTGEELSRERQQHGRLRLEQVVAGGLARERWVAPHAEVVVAQRERPADVLPALHEGVDDFRHRSC